jgi:hypothetical protein
MNVAIVGAGPVGIYLAKLLLDNGHKITIIDSGNLNEESDLLTNKNYSFQSRSSMPSGVHKIGGGSLQWHARISEFIEHDFKNWPINKSDLNDHYAELYKFLEVGNLNDQEIIEKYFAHESSKLFPELRLRSFRFCDPEFFIKLFKEISVSKSLQILVGHFCVKAFKDEYESRVSLELLKKNFETTILEFDKVIIAGGTFQSTALLQRTLQATAAQNRNQIGNCLMEHLEGYVGKVTISRKNSLRLFKRLSLDEDNRATNTFSGIGVAISVNESLSNKKLINTQYEIRKFMPGPYMLLVFKNKFEHKLLSKIFDIAIFFEKSFRFSGRKIRVLFDKLTGRRRFSIYIKSEEFPFVNSKVYLADVSQNLLTYDHRISDETYISLLSNMRSFQKIIWDKFALKIKYKFKLNDINEMKSVFGANWHPMGSLRMGWNPKDSVCNPNLEVHNFKDLYVASAAVFPSGSNTNPTFTTLALARRLALSKHFNQS